MFQRSQSHRAGPSPAALAFGMNQQSAAPPQPSYGPGAVRTRDETRDQREAEEALARVNEELKHEVQADFDGALSYALSTMEEVMPHLPQVWQTTFRRQLQLLEKKLTKSSPGITKLEMASSAQVLNSNERLREVTAERDAARKEVADLRSRGKQGNDEAKRAMQQAQTELGAVKAELAKCSGLLSESGVHHRTKMRELEELCASLEKAKGQLSRDKDALGDRVAKADLERAQMRDMVHRLEAENRKLSSDLRDAYMQTASTSARLEAELASARQRADELSLSAEKAEHGGRSASEQAAAAFARLEAIESERKQERQRLSQDCSDLRAENKMLASENGTLKGELRSTAQRLEQERLAAEGALRAAKRDAAAMVAEVQTRLERELADTVAQAEAQLYKSAAQAAERAEADAAELRAAQGALDVATADAAAKGERMHAAETRLAGALASLDQEKTEARRLRGELEATASAAQRELAEAMDETTKARSSAAAARAELVALRDMVISGDGSVQRLNGVDTDKLLALTKSSADAALRTAEAEALRAEVAQLRKQVAELDAALLAAESLRRKLHNQVQELRGKVRVFCRVRPMAEGQGRPEDAALQPLSDGSSLHLRVGDAKHAFSFDRVFDMVSSQEAVFEEVSQLVQSALDGFNVCIFSYGQTGSGKTHTMLGAPSGPERGIIPRAVDAVLSAATRLGAKGWFFSMEACYVEIYNEQVRDLLRPGATHSDKHTITHNAHGLAEVSGATREPVRTVAESANLVRRASNMRAVEATNMNATSSRSHTIFMLYVVADHESTGQRLLGALNLVDLAGSERVERSGAKGDRLKEASAINKSLSHLGEVFNALGNKASHVPYRNSKLTYLLAPCLGGDGKCMMLVNAAPEDEHAEETLCSLRFASNVSSVDMKAVKGGAKRNVVQKHEVIRGNGKVPVEKAGGATAPPPVVRDSSGVPTPRARDRSAASHR